MNPLLKSKCSIPILMMIMLSTSVVTSCDNEWPDDLCDCPNGGNGIGGWGDANDTTIVNKQDTLGGFEITLDDWGNINKQDIRL